MFANSLSKLSFPVTVLSGFSGYIASNKKQFCYVYSKEETEAVRQTLNLFLFFAAVHVVLVTDLLVFLTERDQKYHLAALQDLKVRLLSERGSNSLLNSPLAQKKHSANW